jgi:hypothetical protein
MTARYLISLPHKGNIQILADLARQIIDDLGVSGYLGSQIAALVDSVTAAFADKYGTVACEMLDELASFHSVTCELSRPKRDLRFQQRHPHYSMNWLAR